MSKKQTISITGATGHLGNKLILDLLDQGHQVKALYHSRKPNVSHERLTWTQGSILEPNDLKKLTQGTDVLIHSAAKISIHNKDRKEVINTNLTGTKNAVYACLENDCKLIYISSINAVDPNPIHSTLNENRPYRDKHKFAYAYSKAKAEKLVQAAVIKKGLKSITIRPSSIIGPPDLGPSLLGASLIKFSKQRIVFVPNAGFDFVDVRDLSNGIIQSLNRGLFIGDVYHLCGNYASFRTLIKMINPDKTVVQIPMLIMKACLPFVRLINVFLKSKIPFTTESLHTMQFAPQQISNQKAIEQLNFSPRSLQDSMNEFNYWFKS
ncbi:MAG: NAD-dependent epimerase/dehydratase family protein [Reichenbachiella sp.]